MNQKTQEEREGQTDSLLSGVGNGGSASSLSANNDFISLLANCHAVTQVREVCVCFFFCFVSLFQGLSLCNAMANPFPVTECVYFGWCCSASLFCSSTAPWRQISNSKQTEMDERNPQQRRWIKSSCCSFAWDEPGPKGLGFHLNFLLLDLIHVKVLDSLALALSLFSGAEFTGKEKKKKKSRRVLFLLTSHV